MTRQKQRRVVFQLIYSLSFQGLDQKDTVLNEFYNQDPAGERYLYIDQTFEGIVSNWAEIDQLIEPALKNWALNRVSSVCRAILRVAVYELKFNSEVPDRVAINEAIEIAKEFGEDDAPAFVHGVLGKIAS